MKVTINPQILSNVGERYGRISNAMEVTTSRTRDASVRMRALVVGEFRGGLSSTTIALLDEAIARLASAAQVVETVGSDLRRRAGLIDETTGGQHGPGTAPGPQSKYLSPTGTEAVELKKRLAELAKAMGITPPVGFDPSAPIVGEPARQLIRMILAAKGLAAAGGFNAATRQLLKDVRLPGSWASLLAYPGDNAKRKELACWLAANAHKSGAPAILAVMCAIPESGISNVDHGDKDSVGFFQIRVSIHPAPAGFGGASGKLQTQGWWHAHPEAQVAWWANEMKSRRPAGLSQNTKNPAQLANWAYSIERCAAEYRHRYRDAYDEAKRLVDACGASSGGGGANAPAAPVPSARPGSYTMPTGPSAVALKGKLEALARQLGVAIPNTFDSSKGSTDRATQILLKRVQERLGFGASGVFDRQMHERLAAIVLPGSPFASKLIATVNGERGVHETGENWGSKVAEYLRSANVNGPAPWCAAFVTWALIEAGDPTPFRSAAVRDWVTAAKTKTHGMEVVDPADVRPGDLVAFDWGGQSDFGKDGHIGVVSSKVVGGRFTTVEGNSSNAVSANNRSMGDGRIVFIRVNK